MSDKKAISSSSALDNVDVDGDSGDDDNTRPISSGLTPHNDDMNDKNKKKEDIDDMPPMEYDAADDAMHVDFNEDQWLPCIPGLSLTAATMIMAIIGGGVGLTIALTIGEKDGLPEDWMTIIEFPGKLWVNGLKLLVLPLLVLMMIVLPSRVDEIGAIGKRAVPLLLFTSSCASLEGTIWAWIIQPGTIGRPAEDLDTVTLANADVRPLEALLNVFYNAVPSNIVSAMSSLTILGVITFFLMIGILLRKPQVKKEERDAVLNVSRALLRCIMQAIVWVVWFTPIGMASLIALKLATTDNLTELMAALGFYVLTVLIGHGIHVFGVYPAIFFATTRGNGWKFFSKIYPAPLLAFATSSSAATLPRSLQVSHAAGVRPEIYQFILPLGSAINMDGTALGFPIMVGLIAQLNNVDIGIGNIMIAAVLSVVISVGTAPIPNAGMVYLTMLFASTGLAEYTEDGLATLFVLDWFVDRIETAVNVTSDQFVAKIIDDVSQNAQKKHVNIVLGCCIGSGDPNADGYEAPELDDRAANV